MLSKYFPIEFSSYEEYVKYLKEKGFAIDLTNLDIGNDIPVAEK